MRRFAIVLLASLAIVIGCGGGGGIVSYDGQYHNTYTRGAGGTIVLALSEDTVTIVINDSDARYRGAAFLDGNSFTVTCFSETNQVIVDGSFTGSGASRAVAGTVSGAVAFAFTANLQFSPDVQTFAHSYQTFYGHGGLRNPGDPNTGLIVCTASATGAVTGTISPGGQPQTAISGQVNSVGRFVLTTLIESNNYTFVGIGRVMPGNQILVEGTWTNSPPNDRGTWQGENVD